MRRRVMICVALLAAVGSADAQPRPPETRQSAPIIAGQPSVRVTPSGNVVAPAEVLPRRDINGKVRVRHHRTGPG